jgi:hypothetical protein
MDHLSINEPSLRQKSLARMKYKHKDQIYNNKHVRNTERRKKKPEKFGAKYNNRNDI